MLRCIWLSAFFPTLYLLTSFFFLSILVECNDSNAFSFKLFFFFLTFTLIGLQLLLIGGQVNSCGFSFEAISSFLSDFLLIWLDSLLEHPVERTLITLISTVSWKMAKRTQRSYPSFVSPGCLWKLWECLSWLADNCSQVSTSKAKPREPQRKEMQSTSRGEWAAPVATFGHWKMRLTSRSPGHFSHL